MRNTLHSRLHVAATLALVAGPLAITGCFGPTHPTKSIATSPGNSTPDTPQASPGEPQYIYAEARSLQPVRTIRDAQVVPAEHVLLPLDAWTEQQAAADALGRIGPPAVPPLVAALESSDPQARLRAAEVLARMGSDAKDAVPALTRLLDDPNESIRKAATRALGRIGPAAEEAVPALVRALLESESRVVPASAEQEP
jgi:HEAT repeat protein